MLPGALLLPKENGTRQAGMPLTSVPTVGSEGKYRPQRKWTWGKTCGW